MLQSPCLSVKVPPRKLKWRLKLRRLGLSLTDISALNPGIPTPGTSAPKFLTPLDIHEESHYTPLVEHQSLFIGDFALPPPPPVSRKKHGTTAISPQILPPRPTALGPKVKPYVTRQMPRSFSDGAIAAENCFICQEPLETRLESEKIISCCCGDCVHSECMKTALAFEFEMATKKGTLSSQSSFFVIKEAILPKCRGRLCKSKSSPPLAEPVNQDFLTEAVDDAVLSLKLSKANAPVITKSRSEPIVQRPKFPSFEESRDRFSRYTDRTSLATSDGDFRATSPAHSMCTVKTTSVRLSMHAEVPIDDLKNSFIKRMLDNCKVFDLSLLVALGSLRLVDKLLVGSFCESFEEANVYLFTHYLVIWSEQREPTIFPLDLSTQVETPIPSVLQITSGMQCLKLHSEIGSIIEKWVIAISDLLLVFPSDIITSTIPLVEVGHVKPVLWANPFSLVKKVSPILESAFEFSPFDHTPSSTFSKKAEILDDGYSSELLGHVSPSCCISRPTSPLRLRSSSDYQQTKSESDSDSDSEMISKVIHSHKGIVY